MTDSTPATAAPRPGDQVVLVTFSGAEYAVEVVSGPSLPCGCHVVRWTGLQPLSGSDTNTVCFSQFKEVRRA